MFFTNNIFKDHSERIFFYARTAVFTVIGGVLIGTAIGKFGLLAGLGMMALPIVILVTGWMFSTPQVGILFSIFLGFTANGIARYVEGVPWGLMIDISLFVAWLSLLFQKFRHTDWSPLSHGAMLMTTAWFSLILIELINPEGNGPVAWFYAMRTVGFYQLLLFGLIFMHWRDVKYVDKFLKMCFWFSIVAAIWGLRQNIFGVDAAEHRWLYVGGYATQHVLFGVLRVFSFYSDAGQFGASQAMFAIMGMLLAVSPHLTFKERMFYGIGGILSFIGFGISGTRGAIAVIGAGAILYIFLSKNIKIMVLGATVVLGAYSFLKFTKGLQNVEQIRRMRTSLDSDDASLLVRLENQKKFARYLKTRPIGGGVGTAGFWGEKFGPWKTPAQIATDSHYVRVWAETGIVGISLHLMMFGYFLGRGGYIIWHLKNDTLKIKVAALLCGFAGVIAANYGNQITSQTPTGIVISIGIPLVMLAPLFEKQLEEEAKRKAAKET
jgi:O-Antigen ligase